MVGLQWPERPHLPLVPSPGDTVEVPLSLATDAKRADVERLAALLQEAEFVFARTMADNPHHYTRRQSWLSAVDFDDPMHYFWNRGDGTFSDNGNQGAHTYAEPGVYQLCLTVTALIPGTQDTCSTTSYQWVTIVDTDPCEAFNATVTVNPVGNRPMMRRKAVVSAGSRKSLTVRKPSHSP